MRWKEPSPPPLPPRRERGWTERSRWLQTWGVQPPRRRRPSGRPAPTRTRPGERRDMDVVIVQAFNALSLSSILLLIALGLVFSFGLMNVINMAHGEFIMVGAYVTFVVQRVFLAVAPDLSGIYLFVAMILAF